ncbi:unnamed protein product [Closterium sp. Yama58-4]|nr:unnamed protein product [Closterium sp. Yama58-4]
MVDNAGITPSFSDLLGDGSPMAKKACKAASSSSSRLLLRPLRLTLKFLPPPLCWSLASVILTELHRKDIVACIKKNLRRSDFKNWQIPTFKSMAGGNLKFAKRTYARQILQFPNKEAAEDFRARPPIFFSPTYGLAVELKVYIDPAPEFTAAKAYGETHIVIRNIPLGLLEKKLYSVLMNGKNREGQKWIADLQHFHSASDPYEKIQLQMHGIVVPMPGDAAFSVTPPIIWIPGPKLSGTRPPSTSSSRILASSSSASTAMSRHGLAVCANSLAVGPSIRRSLTATSPSISAVTSGPLLKKEYGGLKAHVFLKNDKLVNFLAEE